MNLFRPFGFLALLLTAIALDKSQGWGLFSAVFVFVASLIIGVIESCTQDFPPDWPYGPGPV